MRAARIHDGMKVADFGVGSGFFTRGAARAVGERGAVFAIDIDGDLLARMRTLACDEGLSNIEYIRGDLEHIHGSGLPDESLDAVIIANILFQVKNKEKLIEEAWRVLRKGGRAIVFDWTDSFGGLGPHPLHVFKPADAKKLFERGGFAFLEEVPAGSYHWGYIFKKK